MELKDYQIEVLDDLEQYLSKVFEPGKRLDESFRDYWNEKYVNLKDGEKYFHPYNNKAVKNVPRVTAKVPTAGGKTFIACNAIKTIFDGLPKDCTKVVVWFVPSDTILKQTFDNLNNPTHEYRQKLDALFNHSVKVVDKESALLANGIKPVQLLEQLTIFVLSVDSFVEAVRGKDNLGKDKLPRVYRQNENLPFVNKIDIGKEINIPQADANSLIVYLAKLNPVVIIDESHNYGSKLRVDLLNHINPCFIYELTATPKESSNIISFVDAIKLKNEHMVKLPVMVYNNKSTDDVIVSAKALQENLERIAIKEREAGGEYIRPIVLFQAQSNTDDESINFEKIKEELIDTGIPEERIKIKTANVNELKNINLMSEDCPVRYIITVDALKEGWDCPFAYVLASLANRNSSIAVEQILGRILRQPHATDNKASSESKFLNMAYVLTSSSQFKNTVNKIVESLNNCGFSGRDSMVSEDFIDEENNQVIEGDFLKPYGVTQNMNTQNVVEKDEPEIDSKAIKKKQADKEQKLKVMMDAASNGNDYFNKKVEEANSFENQQPQEVRNAMKNNTYPVKPVYKKDIENLKLPVFKIKVQHSFAFDIDELKLLEKDDLMDDFSLWNKDKQITFYYGSTESQLIDLEERKKDEWVPTLSKAPESLRNALYEWIEGATDRKIMIDMLTRRILQELDNYNNIDNSEIKSYVSAVLEHETTEHLKNLALNIVETIKSFRKKFDVLALEHREKQFNEKIILGDIIMDYEYVLPENMVLTQKCPHITNSLYTEEGKASDFEIEFINKIADSVRWWHRNPSRPQGYNICGFVNHYPDFIIKLNNGKVLFVETKGDHLDNSESAAKIRLGEKIQYLDAQKNFLYFMAFEKEGVDKAIEINKLAELILKMK
jgi:type III restriction enzyme